MSNNKKEISIDRVTNCPRRNCKNTYKLDAWHMVKDNAQKLFKKYLYEPEQQEVKNGLCKM